MSYPLSLQQLKPILESRGIKMRREWGQNLLVDANMLAAIVRDSGVGPADTVLEIGVGAGSLTQALCGHAGLVVGVDIDRGMLALARELLAGRGNLATMRCDVMGAHNQLNPKVLAVVRRVLGLDDGGQEPLLDDDGGEVVLPDSLPLAGGQFRVVANLPYSISSPLLLALLESRLPVASMTLMLQLEVARKLCARPGDDDWGVLSLLASEFAESKLVRRVPAACFWPRPKVDSATVQVIPRDDAPSPEEYARIRQVVHGLFQHRRKSILNGARMGLGMEGDAARRWLESAGIEPSRHAEDLGTGEIHRLAELFRG